MNHRLQELKLRLDEQLQYPASFLFKFIVPIERAAELKTVFNNNPVTAKPSRNGNYVSLSSEYEVKSSDEIIDVYRAASRIEGVIML
jgi:uncharacterized protein